MAGGDKIELITFSIPKSAKNESDYIALNFEEARRLKWARGVDQYRGGDASAPFAGEPCEEAFQECIDLANLLEIVEQQYGAPTALLRSQVEQLAHALQRIRRVYPRNIHR